MERRTLTFFHVVANRYPNVSCVRFHKGMRYVRTSEDLPPGLVDFVLFQGVFQFVVSLSFELAVHTHTHTHIYIYICVCVGVSVWLGWSGIRVAGFDVTCYFISLLMCSTCFGH